MYSESAVYIVGHGKTSSDNAITTNFKIFFIGFVVDTSTDIIEDVECAATVSITSKFVHDIFVGKSFAEYDEGIVDMINRRYFGTSQKAIIIAYKDAIKKYKSVKQEYY